MKLQRRIVGTLLVLAVLGAAMPLAVGLYPADLPAKQDPTFIDTVFDNRGVVWMARLLLVSAAGVLAFGGVFIVLSIGIRMRNGEWLRRAGPFEISETDAREIEDQMKVWREAALTGWEEVEAVTERQRKSDELRAMRGETRYGNIRDASCLRKVACRQRRKR